MAGRYLWCTASLMFLMTVVVTLTLTALTRPFPSNPE